MKPVLTQYDRDEDEYVEVLPSDADKALDYVISKMRPKQEAKMKKIKVTKIKHKGLKGSNTPKESLDYVTGLGDLGDSGPAAGELPSGGGYEGGDGGAGPSGGGVGASLIKPKTKLQTTAAPADTDKQRKLAQIRKRKASLREKKEQMVHKISDEIHKLNGEAIKIKYGNKPKPRKKTPKVTPKKPKKKYPS